MLIVAFALTMGVTAAAQESPFPRGIGPIPDFRGFQMANDPRLPEIQKSGIVVRRLADNVHVIAVTNNIVVQTGNDGVFFADNSFSMFFDLIMGAVRKISDKPVKIVTNSHSHYDHGQNNAELAQMGALIFTPTNLRNAMIRPAQGQPAGSNPNAALPWIAVDAPMTIHFNGEDVMYLPLKPAHTDGDLAVYFTKSNVWSFGDVWTNDYPSIGVAQGGTIENFVENYNRALALTNEDTIFVPGHGQLGKRADLIANRDALLVIHERFLNMMRDGMTLEQIRAARPTKEYDAKYATEICCSPNTMQTSTRFYEQMFNEVKTHLPAGR
jgi:glyoxylase-like metal-dependent hydrolase (beta-lactamase superfamily II)